METISHYNDSRGIKFLTYVAPSIKNTMTDLIRNAFTQYEQWMTDTKDGLAFQKIRLDEVIPSEDRLLLTEAITDPIAKLSDQIYEKRETLRELDEIGEQVQAYLPYHYGFTDDMEHTLIGMVIHFSLSERRAKKIEEDAMDNHWLELPWWFQYIQG